MRKCLDLEIGNFENFSQQSNFRSKWAQEHLFMFQQHYHYSLKQVSINFPFGTRHLCKVNICLLHGSLYYLPKFWLTPIISWQFTKNTEFTSLYFLLFCTLKQKFQIQKLQMLGNQKDQKKINARVMKWRQMLDKGLQSDPQLLIKRTRKGIPTSMRIRVWPELVKMSKVVQRKSMSYSKVLIKDSMDIYDINLDIPRTFSFQSQEVLKQSLFDVLKALSIQFPQIGYCQGMNFLTMRLLQILDDDTTFYMMTYILRKHRPIYDNFRNPGYVARQNAVYSRLLHNFMPKVEKLLIQHNLQPVLYTPSWFLTLFSKSLSEQKFYRFFQCFLVEGYCFLYRMVLAMVKLKEKQILKNSMQQNFTFLPDMDFYNQIDDDILIQTACQFEIDNQQIKKLEDAYNKEHHKEIQKLEKSSMQSYQKKVQAPRRNFEWTIDDFKKTRSNLVKFED